MKHAFINAKIYDFNKFSEDQYVIFDETILEVGNMSDFKDNNYEIIDCTDHLVLPSLVVGHTHIYSTFARGMSVPFNPTNFQEILDQLWWKMDRNLDNEMNYYSGIVSATDYMKNGVTTVIDHHASGVDIKGSLNTLKKAVTEDAGLRGLFCFETSDRFDVEACLDENLSFIEDNYSNVARGLFGLHASLSLSEETLVKISKVIKNYPIHIHVAESLMDQEDSLDKYNERVIERLDRHGLLNEDSIITHALFVSDEELDIIKKRKCVVALNVNSNMNNSVGLPDYKRFKEKGIPVILGNDGIASSITSEYLTLLYTMHLKDESPLKFGLGDIFEIINNTYNYVNRRLGTKLGRVEVGYSGDLITIPYIAPTTLNKGNALGHLFFGMFNSFKPNNVFCKGVKLVNNYKVSDDLTEKYREAKKYANKLWENIQKEDA
ncbi:MAG: 5-methylthioadenosine/S-adenosylhomocysteine deaminase [Candidatus Izimaplasma bacterium HR2]|nr:MAG: 5-methylthioadenosine/S-adenosylhomocysteine deaminase [Candidatus Izimaplasma bacterium HR2]